MDITPEMISALSVDIQQQPNFHMRQWQTLREKYPNWCGFVERRLLELLGNPSDAQYALTVIIDGYVLADAAAFTAEHNSIITLCTGD